MADIGKMIIGAGIVMIIVGLVLILAQKIPFLGKLPGDILVKKDNVTFYFPLATCILLSVILSLLSMLWTRK